MKANQRKWAFRVLAVLLGCLPFALVEGTLQFLRLPSRPPAVDPYVDLHNLRPLLQPDPNRQGHVQIAEERLHLFRSLSFAKKKPKDTLRIIALGGSTTQGEPFSTETAFPKWCGLSVELATGVETEVLNLGGLSYASYRVLAILRESLQYSPDLIIIYTGHNEFLERRTYAGYRERSRSAWLTSQLTQLHSVQMVRQALGWQGYRNEARIQTPTELAREVDALLDYRGGLADYSRRTQQHDAVFDHFRWNLTEMVRVCRDANVPLILVRPFSNLKDCPPIKFETATPELRGVSKDFDATEFEDLFQTARTSESMAEAASAATVALEMDPHHAGVNYLLGSLAYQNREDAAALKYLTAAKDYDVCPLRAPTEISNIVTAVATQFDVPLVKADELFAEVSPRGIVGDEWLVDHIHPSVEGHQLLGKTVAAECLRQGLIRAAVSNPNWEVESKQSFAEYLSTINEAYFHRGHQRLEGLILWTQGRSKKIRDTESNTLNPVP